jgi:hypothetical protein
MGSFSIEMLPFLLLLIKNIFQICSVAAFWVGPFWVMRPNFRPYRQHWDWVPWGRSGVPNINIKTSCLAIQNIHNATGGIQYGIHMICIPMYCITYRSVFKRILSQELFGIFGIERKSSQSFERKSLGGP